jgi:hypothetical protein
VFITTRWTKDEAAAIDAALLPRETRSQFFRRLLRDHTEPEVVTIVDGRGTVIASYPYSRTLRSGDTIEFTLAPVIIEN